MKLDIRKLFSTFFLLVFLGSTAMFLFSFIENHKGEAAYQAAESVANIATEPPIEVPTESPTEESTEPAEAVKLQWKPVPVTDNDPNLQTIARINLNALRTISPQVTGWIFIPGTRVHYPILQGEDNDYYLNHTWEGESNLCGSIFMEAMNSAHFTDFNTIIYGHNMKNGSMFAALHDYSTLDFWAQHPYVYLATDEGVLRYEIYSTYRAAVDSKTYALNLDHRHMPSFIQMTLDESDFDTGIVPADTDRILTLSTCTGDYETRRVVHARLVMEEVEVKNDPLPTESGSESVG